jgi:hypothetical protein
VREQLARTCLAMDPAEQRQTMRDVLTDLQWIASSASREGPAKSVITRRGLPVWIWQAAAIVFAAATIALIATSRRPMPNKSSRNTTADRGRPPEFLAGCLKTGPARCLRHVYSLNLG